MELLLNAGYRPQVQPIRIGPLEHRFAAVLAGRDRSIELVVVADTLEEPEKELVVAIRTLGRALDLVGSRRPLTVVLVGPTVSAAAISAMGRVARVLVVEPAEDGRLADQSLRDSVAGLLPLSVDAGGGAPIDPLALIPLSATGVDLETVLLDAARSRRSVRDEFRHSVDAALREKLK